MVSFQGKYEVLSALSDGESQSFRARQISSGRPVIVHHLAAGRTPPPQPDLASLIFRFLRSASAEEGRNFLDMGEEDGRIFVVTADVPECSDLRKWLQRVAETRAGKEGDAQPSAEGTPDLGNLAFTRAFTTEALRQFSHFPVSKPVPPSPVAGAAQSSVSPPEKSPGDLIPSAEIAAAPSESTDRGPTEFTLFWEKYSPANPAAPPAAIPAPITLPKSSDGPSEVPEVRADYLSRRSSLSVQDAPTEPMKTLRAQSADRERALAAVARPAEAKGDAGQFADLVLTPLVAMKPPQAPPEAAASKLSPQPIVPPAAIGPETQTPREFTGLLVENDKVPPQAEVLPSTPSANDKLEAEVKPAAEVPPPQIPRGFEVVFQSSKPRKHPTLSGAPDQSGMMTAPAPFAPGTRPDDAAPTIAAEILPHVTPPAVSPVAEKIGGNPALPFPKAPGEQKRAVGNKKEPSVPPPPPTARQAFKEPERATRLVPAPPMTPAGYPAPPGGGQPGEYTRMIRSVKALAGPLSPVGPSGVPSADDRPAATPAVPASALSRASYLHVPVPHPPSYHDAPPQLRPPLYPANDTPSHSARKKRKVWVPILILGSLFLVTVALLLFFAFKP